MTLNLSCVRSALFNIQAVLLEHHLQCKAKKPFYTNVIKALTSIKSNEAFYESLWDYINIDPIPQE